MTESNVLSSQLSPVEFDVLTEPPMSGSWDDAVVQEQHGKPPGWFLVLEPQLSRLLQSYSLAGHPSGSGHETDQFCIPAQVLIQFLKRDAFTESPPFISGNESPADSEQHDTPFYPVTWMIPAAHMDQFLQYHADLASELPSSEEISAESLSQFLQMYKIEIPRDLDDEVDVQPDEASASVIHECPVCQSALGRVQERNRHVESHLPHSILCPFRGCNWTGRRQWDFQGHWRKKHPEAGQAPGEIANEIYDTKDFVQSILDGKPVEEVAQYAFTKVLEGLERLGKPDVGANVLGRNRELKKWIPTSQLNQYCNRH